MKSKSGRERRTKVKGRQKDLFFAKKTSISEGRRCREGNPSTSPQMFPDPATVTQA